MCKFDREIKSLYNYIYLKIKVSILIYKHSTFIRDWKI